MTARDPANAPPPASTWLRTRQVDVRASRDVLNPNPVWIWRELPPGGPVARPDALPSSVQAVTVHAVELRPDAHLGRYAAVATLGGIPTLLLGPRCPERFGYVPLPPGTPFGPVPAEPRA